jgi:hypothetical protein
MIMLPLRILAVAILVWVWIATPWPFKLVPLMPFFVPPILYHLLRLLPDRPAERAIAAERARVRAIMDSAAPKAAPTRTSPYATLEP